MIFSSLYRKFAILSNRVRVFSAGGHFPVKQTFAFRFAASTGIRDPDASSGALPSSEPLFPEDGTSCFCLQLCIDSRMQNPTAAGTSLMQQAEPVFAFLEQEASQDDCEVTVTNDGNRRLFLITFREETFSCAGFIEKAASRLRQFNSQNRFILLTAGVSQALPIRNGSLPKVIGQAGFALRCRLDLFGTSLIEYRPEYERALSLLPPFSRAEQLRSAIADRNEEKACSLISDAFEKSDLTVPGSTDRLLSELLYYINQALSLLPNARSLPAELSVSESSVLYGELTARKTGEHLKQQLLAAFQKYDSLNENQESSLIQKARQYVAEHYSEEITMEDVARHVVLSPSYFSSLFKSETGTGFIKYLQYVRMEQAKKLLRESSLRIEDIARSVGYRDLKYFNKVFRGETGVKPSEYRKLYS